MPWGYLSGVIVALLAAAAALWPPPTHGPRATPAFVLGTASSEIPGFFLLLLVASTLATAEDFRLPAAAVGLGLAAVAGAGLATVQIRAFAARGTVIRAVERVLGPGGAPERLRWHERVRVTAAPFRWPALDVKVTRGLSYGTHRQQRLDVYRSRRRVPETAGAPALVYFHGGGFYSGRRSKESRLLLLALARRGWVCVSADYRLRRPYRDALADAKHVLAWVHQHGAAYGAGDVLVTCGGSAGAHLALTLGLTANRPDLQPDVAEPDTSVTAMIGLYGYYGRADDGELPSAVSDFLHADAPPALIVHGSLDPMSPVQDARDFAARLRAATSPVVYAEVPGALHTFDRFDSVRCAGISVGVLHFLVRLGLPVPY